MAPMKNNTRVLWLAILVVMSITFFYQHAIGRSISLLDGPDLNWSCSLISECPAYQCVLFCKDRGFKEGESCYKIK
ncbi:Os09g0286501 [Oryza sativa Japonica Group]|uniref:Os09g0286501 protein n=1 Tax=Oryza sativa subsp. japonica TaxID=39947 RepID=A0A0P0XKL5_ORYSJ|nr:hypothetical protein EE612_046602 [Oryza sativa]BAT07269.1 Os09g0286501 [Oryza sativa Japonica Group]